MTVAEVLKSFEDYYGEYPRVAMKRYVEKYLEGFKEENLQMLHDRVILEVTSNRFTIPDVATIENVKKRINEERKNERVQPIGKEFPRPKREPQICPKCHREYVGSACAKCGWSPTDEIYHKEPRDE